MLALMFSGCWLGDHDLLILKVAVPGKQPLGLTIVEVPGAHDELRSDTQKKFVAQIRNVANPRIQISAGDSLDSHLFDEAMKMGE